MLFGKRTPLVFHIEGENEIYSVNLKREVSIELFLPASYVNSKKKYPFLILNDGQDAEALRLKSTLSKLTRTGQMQELIVFAIHGGDRMQEYGVSSQPDSERGVYRRSARGNRRLLHAMVLGGDPLSAEYRRASF